MSTLENIEVFNEEQTLNEIYNIFPYLLKYEIPDDCPYYPYYKKQLLPLKPEIYRLPFSDQTQYERYEFSDYRIDEETALQISNETNIPLHRVLKFNRVFESVDDVKEILSQSSKEFKKNQFRMAPLGLHFDYSHSITQEKALSLFNNIKKIENMYLFDVVAGSVMTYGMNNGDLSIFFKEFTVFDAYAIFTLMISETLSAKITHLCQEHQIAKQFFELASSSQQIKEINIYLQTVIAVIFVCENMCGITDTQLKYAFNLIKSNKPIDTITSNYLFCLFRFGQLHSFDIVNELFSSFTFDELQKLVDTYPISLCLIKHLSTLPMPQHSIDLDVSPPNRMFFSYYVNKLNIDYSTVVEFSHNYISNQSMLPMNYEDPTFFSHSYLLYKISKNSKLTHDTAILLYTTGITQKLLPLFTVTVTDHSPTVQDKEAIVFPYSRIYLFRFLINISHTLDDSFYANSIEREINRYLGTSVFLYGKKSRHRFEPFDVPAAILEAFFVSKPLLNFLYNETDSLRTLIVKYLFGHCLRLMNPVVPSTILDSANNIIQRTGAIIHRTFNITSTNENFIIVAPTTKGFPLQINVDNATFSLVSGAFSYKREHFTVVRKDYKYLVISKQGTSTISSTSFKLFSNDFNAQTSFTDSCVLVYERFNSYTKVPTLNEMLNFQSVMITMKDLELAKFFKTDGAFFVFTIERYLSAIGHFGKVENTQKKLLQLKEEERKSILFNVLKNIKELLECRDIIKSPSIMQIVTKFLKIIDCEQLLCDITSQINADRNFKDLFFPVIHPHFTSILGDFFILLSKYSSTSAKDILLKFLYNLQQTTETDVDRSCKPFNILLNKLNQFHPSSYPLFIQTKTVEFLLNVIPATAPDYQYEKINTTAIFRIIIKTYSLPEYSRMSPIERLSTLTLDTEILMKLNQKIMFLIKNCLDTNLLTHFLQNICSVNSQYSKSIMSTILQELNVKSPFPSLQIFTKLLKTGGTSASDLVKQIIQSNKLNSITTLNDTIKIPEIGDFIVSLYNAGGSLYLNYWQGNELISKIRDELDLIMKREWSKYRDYVLSFQRQQLIRMYHANELDSLVYSNKTINLYTNIILITYLETMKGNTHFTKNDYCFDKASLICLNARINQLRNAKKHDHNTIQNVIPPVTSSATVHDSDSYYSSNYGSSSSSVGCL